VLLAGRALLILALATALYGVVASLYGARTGSPKWVASGRRAMYATTLTVAVAFLLLESAFLRSDFSSELVASHSSTTTPAFYRATSIWSSQEGSLLLWVLLLGTWSSIVLFLSRRRVRRIAPYAAAVLLAIAAFFCGLLVFLETPFARASPVPEEGLGLSPLLRHPSMMFHPPMLYSGYTLFTIPFAFAVGALASRSVGVEWIRTTRPFALAAWLCLGVGIVLGARWSYLELGWGGYYAWDGVENASLMPWLTGTAFIHSLMIQERRGMLRTWNVSLILATGILAILGTFLVRSGILSSIHAFGASTLGTAFLALIVVMIAGSIALVLSRRRDLRSEHRIDSLLSREAVFLLNNLVLVALCFVIFWGTFFPLISEAVTGDRASVGPPWFGRYVTPLALALVLLAGLGPLVAWRRTTFASLRRSLRLPVAVAALTGVVLVLATDATRRPAALAMFCLAAFVVAVVVQELWRAVAVRRAMSPDSVPRALVAVIGRNRHRYGGYLVHAGVAVLLVGVAASSAFQKAADVQLRPGQSARVGGYEITYVRPTGRIAVADNGRLERIDLGAQVRTRRGDRTTLLDTERSYFPTGDPTAGAVSRYFDGESTSEVGLRAGLRRDVWTAVSPDTTRLSGIARRGDRVFAAAASLPPEERAAALGEALRRMVESHRRDGRPATFRVLVSPLVTWIWLGALIVVAGGLIALWPFPASALTGARVRGRLTAAGKDRSEAVA
jgi:cytochrome c-type biogenesis protein CcmF